MEQSSVCRQHATIRTPFGSQDLQCRRRCTGMVSSPKRGEMHISLPRWLPCNGSSRIEHLPRESLAIRDTVQTAESHLASEKRDGPAPMLIFLGIIIDTLTGELGLLPEAVTTCLTKKACTRRKLGSLIGTLPHACKVIRPGRSFLRRAISVLSIAKQKHNHIRLNAKFRSDVMWWKMFVTHWNGTAISYCPKRPTRCNYHIRCLRYLGVWGLADGHKWFQLK